MGGRYYVKRWEAEQKALQDNQQQNQQPLQQQDQPNNQEVNNQAVEIEPHGGNANEAQENPQPASLLDYRGLIPERQRTQKGSDRGNTNQGGQGRGRGNTNPDGNGRGRGNTKQDSRGGARTEGKVGVTAVAKEPSRPLSLVRKQGRDTEPSGSDANVGQAKPQSPLLNYPGLVPCKMTQKGRDGGDGKARGRGGSSTMGKATEEHVTALSKKPVNLPKPVKSQAVQIGPNKGNANKDQGKRRSLLLLEPGEEMLEPKSKWPTQKRSGRSKTNQAGKARGGGGGNTKGKGLELQARNNPDEVGRKKAQAKNVGHISQGCKSESLWKQGGDSDSDSDDPSFSFGRRPRSAKPLTFVVMD